MISDKLLFVIIIFATSCLAMTALILFKPEVKLKGYNLAIFWMPVAFGAIIIIVWGIVGKRSCRWTYKRIHS